jgi:hypothetical protein
VNFGKRAKLRRKSEIGTAPAEYLASLIRARLTGKKRDMKPTSHSQPEAKGTKAGAMISLALLVAFGLSSYLNQQNRDINHAAAEHSNRPTVISAYLA